ncbi:hypothetical protein DFJ73DRAFT_493065 [Zopfochytrium polystomum]|nr:hypothetical protein DFJ73DRAFT_493065 [Zopfochytrium polystomum]
MDRSSAAVDLKPARQPQCPSPVAAAASAVPASQPGPPQGLSTPSAPASASASVSVSTSASSISSAATALSASTATAGGPQVVGGGGAVGTSPPSCAQLVSAAATPAGGVAHLLLTPSAIPASSGTGGIVSPSSALVGWMTEDIPELPSMADTISSNQLGPSGMRANGLSLMNSGTVKEVHRNSGQAVHIAPFSVPSDPPEDTMGILSPGLHSEAPVPLFAPNLAMSASTPTSRKATVASDSASFTTSKQYCRNAAGPSHSSVVFHLSAASSSSHLLGIFVDGPGSFSTRPGSAPPTPQIAGLQLQQDFTRHPKAEFKQPCASKRSAEGNPAFKKPSRRRLRMRRLRQTWSSPEELAKALHARMSGATRRRHSLLNERRTRLRLRSDYIKARVIVHRQEEKIASIRLRAKGSLGMVSASLNRLILRRRLRKSKSRADPACEESLRELSEVKRVLHNAFTELSDDSFLRLQTPADLEVAMSKLAAVESSLRGYTNWADLGMAELSPFLQPSMVIGAERSDQPHEPDACKYPAPHSAPTSTSVGDDLTSSIPLGCLPASLPGSVFSPEEHPHHVFSRHSVAEPSPWLLPPLVPTTEKLQDLPNHSHSTTVMSLHPSLFSELSPVQAAPSIDGVLPHPSEYDGFTHTPQAFTVPNSPLPFGDNPLFVSGGKSCESLANVVVRKKYLPVQMFDELDEDEYLDLVSLLPPITRFTLRELDIDEVESVAHSCSLLTIAADTFKCAATARFVFRPKSTVQA